MASPIDQMMIIASQIKEATQRGENTANRVGGLLVDIVDYLSILRVDEVELGPFLTALKNSQLLDPHDGQTLTFSILEDKWTFSSAITQLKLSQKGIEEAVASNYQVLQQTKEFLQGELDQVEADLNGKYDNLATWRVQTDAYIAQYATAYDEEGNLVAMSTIMQTADEVKMEVKDLETKITNIADPESWEQGTTSAEASGKTYDETKADDTKVVRIGNLLPVTQDAYLTFTPTNNNYAVQVLYFNKDKVYCTSATHWRTNWTLLSEVEEGKLKIINQTDVQYIAIKLRKGDGSTAITVDDVKNAGLSLATSNITSYSEFKQTAYEITLAVGENKEQIDATKTEVDNNLYGYTDEHGVHHDGLITRMGGVEEEAGKSAAWITTNSNHIEAVVANFDAEGHPTTASGLVTTGNMVGLFATATGPDGKTITETYFSLYVQETEDGYITGAKLKADKIDMDTNELDVWAKKYHINAEYLDVTAARFEAWFEAADIHSKYITFDTETFNLIAQNITLDATKITMNATTFKAWFASANITSDDITFTTNTYTLISQNVNISSDNITFKATTNYDVIAQNITLSSDNITFKATTNYDVIAQNITLSSDNISFQATTNYDVIAKNITLMADQIDFITDGWQIKNTSGMVTLQLDTLGNLSIAGKLNQCQLMQDLQVGDGKYKIFVRPKGTENGAELVGMSDSTVVFNLGFSDYDGNIKPSLRMNGIHNLTNLSLQSNLYPGNLTVQYSSSMYSTLRADYDMVGVSMQKNSLFAVYRIRSRNNIDSLFIGGDLSLWTQAINDNAAGDKGVDVGYVYVDQNTGSLKVRRS